MRPRRRFCLSDLLFTHLSRYVIVPGTNAFLEALDRRNGKH